MINFPESIKRRSTGITVTTTKLMIKTTCCLSSSLSSTDSEVSLEMGGSKGGYAWAISAGLNAALAAISAKLFSSHLFRYGLVIFFNVVMWGCYVNSLKVLSSLQATGTNFATNFLSSGLAGFVLFEESLSIKWFAGALLIVIGVLVLSKSSIEGKRHSD